MPSEPRDVPLRSRAYLMHPPALDAQGLQLSLRNYIDGFAGRSGLECRLKTNGAGEKLPVRLQRSVFRIVQEGLANVYRHASASRVSVELRRIGPHLHVVITDNGRGMESGPEHKTRPPLRPGVGIRGIAMRLNQLKGRLSLSRAPDGGTRLHAALPATRLPQAQSAGGKAERPKKAVGSTVNDRERDQKFQAYILSLQPPRSGLP